MEFTRKAHYVAGENLTDPPDNFPTYVSIVSCGLVRIFFLFASLYDIKVLAEEISITFLNAQCV